MALRGGERGISDTLRRAVRCFICAVPLPLHLCSSAPPARTVWTACASGLDHHPAISRRLRGSLPPPLPVIYILFYLFIRDLG